MRRQFVIMIGAMAILCLLSLLNLSPAGAEKVHSSSAGGTARQLEPNAAPGATSDSPVGQKKAAHALKQLAASLHPQAASSLDQLQMSTRGVKGANAEQYEGDFEKDADMKTRSGVELNKQDYLRRRGEMIAMLRGLPLPEDVSPDARAQAIRQMERQEAQQRSAAKAGSLVPEISGSSWTPIGPAPIPLGQTTGVQNPVSGRVLSIAVHPSNPNIVYVGTAQGGLYRTIDGGTTWTAIMDTAQSLAIGAIAIDPVTPTTLFVGTGEGNLCGDCFFGVGMYRILTAETTPVLQGPFNTAAGNNNAFLANSRSITKIVVSPTNNNILYVGTSSGVGGSGGNAGPSTSNRGLFRCDNAQAATPTFTKLNIDGPPATTNHPVRDIEFEPGNSNNLLVAVVDTIAFATSGVYRSTNAADALPGNVTFTKTLTSPAAEQAFNIQLTVNNVAGVVTVYAALDELDPACASCNALGNYGTVKKSIDGGVTWTPAPLTGASGFAGGQGFYDLPIAVDPGNPLNVLVGGSGDYDADETPSKRSVDGGGAWTKTSVGLHPDTHDIVFAPSNPLIVYHGNDGGIFKSTDGGGTWASLNNTGFNATQFTDLSTHPTDRDYMIGGTQDNGTPFLQPGNVWKLGDFGDGGYSIIDQNATDTVTVTAYHTYFNATNAQIGFARAQTTAEIDPGVTGWPDFYGCGGTANGISCADGVLFYAPMAQGPGNPNTLYFGTTKLYRSADKGPTMPAVSQTFASPLSSIAISPNSDNVRLVGGSTGNLFGTSTGANPLVNLDAGNTVPNNFVGRVVIDPTDNTAPYTAYVTLGGFGLGGGQHIYKTTNLADAGTTWSVSGFGIPDVPVNALAIDPLNSQKLYAGTDIGVWVSVDGGATWSTFSTGLPRVAVFDMEFQARSNGAIRVLRIATHGRGIWEITPLSPSAAPAVLSGRVVRADGAPVGGTTIRLSGASAAAAITDANGNYRFSNLDSGGFYTVTPELANYSFSPSNRSFSLVGDKTDATFTAAADAAIVANAIDTAEYFVRQQYLDFLGREPDAGGFNYWRDQANSCNGDADCVRTKRIDVSAAFFLSQEFKDTGSFVYRLYKGSLGRQLRYSEFSADRAQVVGGPNLESSKTAFAVAFVQRAEFTDKYQGKTTAEAFVDALLQTMNGSAGVNLSGERAALINRYNEGAGMNASRALVVRQLVDNDTFAGAVYNQQFVAMQYFGYLRRTPDADGFNFWLNVLNNDASNYRGMVCSFITSAEYQRRFSTVVSHSNAECGR
ncbi:MAG: hypothetical protein JWM21_4457 [Acidobacteria bacterium]|nr:hypothetical protein [Acidobacteriota bacterium]